jgi:hypothetical protein
MMVLAKKYLFGLFILFALTPMMVSAQAVYLQKPVNLSAGKVSLKAMLKTLGEQTGSVFSYDPTKIADNQVLSVSAHTKHSLLTVLQKELPPYIQIKIYGKYVVLQRKGEMTVALKNPAMPVIKMPQSKPLPEYYYTPNKDTATAKLDLTPPTPKIDTMVVPVKVDTLPKLNIINDANLASQTMDTTVNREKSKPVVSSIAADSSKSAKALTAAPSVVSPKSNFAQFIKNDFICQLEFAGFNSMSALSLRLGAKGIYAIFSGGGYANNYNLGGIGIGFQFPIYKRIGMNVELVRYKMSSGKSYDLGIRGTVGQCLAEFNYSLNRTFNIFAGPSLVLIKTSYYHKANPEVLSTKDTNISLGNSLQLGLVAGIRMNIPPMFFKK